MTASLHASLGVEDLSPSVRADLSPSAPAYRDAAFLLMVVCVLALTLFAMAFAFRHKLRRRQFPHELHETAAPPRGSVSGTTGSHRRRRRQSRPRNPSRAEVGGLPPRRSSPSTFDPIHP
jgi:hypothetical protein